MNIFHEAICSITFVVDSILLEQESCAVAKMTARCAIYMGALNFRDSLTTPTATIHKIFHGLLFRSTL